MPHDAQPLLRTGQSSIHSLNNHERNTYMKSRFLLPGGLLLALLAGCDTGPKSSRGFRLPDGDAERGKQAFLALQCTQCHRVEGVELPAPTLFKLTLGGQTLRVRTYGELVTSVINPSHVLADEYKKQLVDAKESPMPLFNHSMTVEQMIDLVAFLQSHYKLIEPAYQPPYP
jgi:mono/diheme cytochrome c family protein